MRTPAKKATAEAKEAMGIGPMGGQAVGPDSPAHMQVAMEARAKEEQKRALAARDLEFKQLQEELGNDSDIMFAPGRADLLCGVVREPGWHYLIVTENTAKQGRSRPNMATFMSQGYEVAKLPDGSDANWAEISKAIMRVPQERYDRYRKWIQASLHEANGAVVDSNASRIRHGDANNDPVVYDEDHGQKSVGAAQLGIPVPQA